MDQGIYAGELRLPATAGGGAEERGVEDGRKGEPRKPSCPTACRRPVAGPHWPPFRRMDTRVEISCGYLRVVA